MYPPAQEPLPRIALEEGEGITETQECLEPKIPPPITTKISRNRRAQTRENFCPVLRDEGCVGRSESDDKSYQR